MKMTLQKDEIEAFTQHHKDGSVWAKGQVRGETPVGYWEWFRKGGTIMRSGYFEDGVPVGRWATYDKEGAAYKVTEMKAGNSSKKTVVSRS